MNKSFKNFFHRTSILRIFLYALFLCSGINISSAQIGSNAAGTAGHDTLRSAGSTGNSHTNVQNPETKDSRRILPVFKKTINKYQPFYFFMFIGGFIMMAVIRIINPSYLRSLVSATLNLKLLLTLFKEGIFGFDITNFLLDLLCVGMLSIGVQIIFFVNQPSYYLWILSFITIAYVLKLIAIQLLANIFMSRGEALIHILMHLLFTRFLGIILLPVLFISLYQPLVDVNTLLQIIIIIILIFYIAWLLRLYIQMKSMSTSGIIYLFLYLCTVELSPLAILLKDYIR
jgi:hypothetical protein